MPIRTLRPLSSLLTATALLLVGHGLHLTILPLRAEQHGFSDTFIGVTASAYSAGFVIGCFTIPTIIARVGHIRIFSALLAMFASAILCLDLTGNSVGWLILRLIIGIMMCGAYTVIESWLTDQTAPEDRGKVLAVYTFLVLSAMTVGQFLIHLAPADTSSAFILTAIMIVLALVPVTLTKSLAPAPVMSTKLSFGLLLKRSPTAFAGTLASGVVMGSFWSFGAIYAIRAGGGADFVPQFISAVIVGGALAQYPVGLLSDRIDRRYVLAGLTALTACASFLMSLSDNPLWLLGTSLLFGAAANAIYAVSLAKAADNSKREEFVVIGSSVLLLNACGAMVAPLIVGPLMTNLGNAALLWAMTSVAALASVLIVVQPKNKYSPAVEDQLPFVAAGVESAPSIFDSDPRSSDDTMADLSPLPERPSFSEFEAEFDFEEALEEE